MSVNVLLLVCAGLPLSVTVTVTEKLPDTLGVPDTAPVPLAIVTPAGNPVAAYEYAGVPPLAVTGVKELKAVPCVADGIDPNAVVSVVGPPPPPATLRLNVKVILWPAPSTICIL